MKTMKIMRRLMGCAAAILALSACSESEDLLSAFHSDPNAVRITAQVGKTSADGFTRSNPLGTAEEQAKFNENDEISVQAEGQDAVTYKLVAVGNKKEWQPQDGKFLKWESETMNFTAYYPATFNGNITQPMKYDSENDLAAADFMSFSGPQTNTKDNNNQLSLIMERKMARVVVEIAGFNDQYAGSTIDNVNSLSICGIKAYKHSDKKFYALIDPNYNPSTAPFLSLEVADGESKATEKYTTTPTTFVAGKSYTYQLTVGKNKISVSGISVADWDNTGIITEGSKAEHIIPYITFTANGEQKFKMTTYGGYSISRLEYSVKDSEWASVVAGTEITFGGTNGDLRLRGTNANGTASARNVYSYITFTKNVNVACTGDIRTLLDWRNYNTVKTQNARFCRLFYNCGVLTSAPVLPATTLAENCYNNMFRGCTSLTSAPVLPATTLAENCYNNMFRGCTSLTSAPVLPATTLDEACYYGMFYGCTSLTSAPVLPATTLENECYASMFMGCTSLTSAPVLPATTLANSCYDSMFQGCTSLTSAPKLSAEKLADHCYSYMFSDCNSLSTITMLAPASEINLTRSFYVNWLYRAGRTAASRILKVQDADAYNALVGTGYLPDIWKKDAEGTTVLYENNGNIE